MLCIHSGQSTVPTTYNTVSGGKMFTELPAGGIRELHIKPSHFPLGHSVPSEPFLPSSLSDDDDDNVPPAET